MAPYVGRFAPSPTGPLHLGSLLAALVSYLDAKANDGEWLVRIEDIDPPREVAGASTGILKTLESHGLEWDRDVRYQSNCSARYENLLSKLEHSKLCYRCPCSRKELHDNFGQHLDHCGINQNTAFLESATRFHSHDQVIRWHDLIVGSQSRTITEDFVLRRRDGLYSYQLAVVSDDIDQGVTHVIRGADLIDSTPMQIALYQSLAIAPPYFGHFPLIRNKETGQKLSMQNLAPAVDKEKPIENINRLADLLGLSFPQGSSLTDALQILTKQWSRRRIHSRKDFEV